MNLVIGNWYIVGPHTDGLYSREKLVSFDDEGGVVLTMDNHHNSYYGPKKPYFKATIVREATDNTSKYWFEKEEIFNDKGELL